MPELHGKQQRVAKSPLMYKDSRLVMQRSSTSLKVEELVHTAMEVVRTGVILPAQFSSIGVEITVQKNGILLAHL